MSKQSKTQSEFEDIEPVSMKDAGYKYARIGDSADKVAKYVHSKCPGFLQDIPKEVKEDLFAGFQLRKNELDGDSYYRIGEGGVYIPLPNHTPSEKDKGVVCVNINYAMSFTGQEFGKLKSTDPSKHAIISKCRENFSNYASNRMRALKSKIREMFGEKRARSANDDFKVAIGKIFDSFEKRVKTAKDRGDTTADPVKYLTARDAFWKSYNS